MLKRFLNNQIIRFILVAGINTAFGYGVYAMLLYANLHYTLAVIISTIAGVIFNFKTYGVLVFKSKKNDLILRFILVYIVLYLINISGIALFQFLGLSNYYGGLIMLIPLGILGFLMNKKLVFSK